MCKWRIYITTFIVMVLHAIELGSVRSCMKMFVMSAGITYHTLCFTSDNPRINYSKFSSFSRKHKLIAGRKFINSTTFSYLFSHVLTFHNRKHVIDMSSNFFYKFRRSWYQRVLLESWQDGAFLWKFFRQHQPAFLVSVKSHPF